MGVKISHVSNNMTIMLAFMAYDPTTIKKKIGIYSQIIHHNNCNKAMCTHKKHTRLKGLKKKKKNLEISLLATRS
jgi:ribosome biogenesis protein Tsr3